MLTRVVFERAPILTTTVMHAVGERVKNPPAYAFQRSGDGRHRGKRTVATTGSPLPQEIAAWPCILDGINTSTDLDTGLREVRPPGVA